MYSVEVINIHPVDNIHSLDHHLLIVYKHKYLTCK